MKQINSNNQSVNSNSDKDGILGPARREMVSNHFRYKDTEKELAEQPNGFVDSIFFERRERAKEVWEGSINEYLRLSKLFDD